MNMEALIRPLDNMLNRITMYRLVLYGLILLLMIAAVFGFTGVISISGPGLLASTAVLVAVSYLTNKLLARLYQAATNSESYLITALILACILPPTTSLLKLAYIGLAALLATSSKFILTWRRRHIFNPAAISAAIIGLLGLVSVNWWIGSPYMLPFTLLLGLLVVRKIRRFSLVIVFALATSAMLFIVAQVGGRETIPVLKNAILSGPLVFFGTIMLTEPATMPSIKYYQLLYGLLAGALYSAQLRLGLLSTSPQMVLLAGNLFAFAVNPHYSMRLRLKEKIQVSPRVYDYVFIPETPLRFIPGQYMEWTLPHRRIDGRGNRRSFTIASSPTEGEVHLGVKFYEPSSSYKRALQALPENGMLVASQLSGDFTLPADTGRKLVFIAGGIGITPFRSMLKYLLDTGQQRDIVLLYIVSQPEELAYPDILQSARQVGLRYIPLHSAQPGAMLSMEDLARHVPDFAERTYYLSGPDGFVRSYKEQLLAGGILRQHIVTDYFSGY